MDSRLFVSAQASSLTGLATLGAGNIGVQFQVGSGAITAGGSTTEGIHFEAGGGAGGSVSGSLDVMMGTHPNHQYEGLQAGVSHANLPAGRLGIGAGSWAGVGGTTQGTYGLPTARELWNGFARGVRGMTRGLISPPTSAPATCTN